MSKTVDYGRIGNQDNLRYANIMQAPPIDPIKDLSVSLNPEARNKSQGLTKKRSIKPSSKAHQRLQAYSLDKK